MSSSAAAKTPPDQLWLERWRQAQAVDMQAFLAEVGPLPPVDIVAVLLVEQRERWGMGQRIPTETYLSASDQVRSSTEATVELIFGEYLLRELLGEAPQLAEYQFRFPQQADWLAKQIALHDVLHSETSAGSSACAHAPTESAAAGRSDGIRAPGLPILPGYEVLAEVGRGGMGVVYKARQRQPERLVALKMLLAGSFAGPGRQARFQREANAIARLQHPHIVRIHHVGEHAGLEYLALEYVDGLSLAQQPGGMLKLPRDAAALIETLARAVHHAHENGVIHRDLKPGNVLLTREGTPKIADFGLAKQAESDLTATDVIVGTPSYMAPEQASGNKEKIGLATDVYALGAILYEMLTGRPPFTAATMLETLEQVRTRAPLAPRQLQPKVPRDLETICLMCLRKEPEKRYPSARELAEDCTAFLQSRPIRARATPVWERVWMSARRRPLLATSLTGTLLALGGLLVSWLAFTVALRTQTDRATASALDAEKQWQRAEAKNDQTLEAVDRFLSRIGEQKLAAVPGVEEVRRDLLLDALKFFQGFLKEKDNPDPRTRAETARAYQRVARIHQMLGQPEEQRQAVEQALALQRPLQAEFPGDPNYCRDLATTLHMLAVNLRSGSRQPDHLEQAERLLTEALALRQGLARDYPDHRDYPLSVVRTYAALGMLHRSTPGPGDRVEQSYRAGLEVAMSLTRAHPDFVDGQVQLGLLHENLAVHYFRHRQIQAAEEEFERGRTVLARLAEQYPADPEHNGRLATITGDLGILYAETGRVELAVQAQESRVALAEKLFHEHASVPGGRSGLAQAYNNLAYAYEKSGRLSEQEAALEKACTLLRELVRDYPGVQEYAFLLAKITTNLSVALIKRQEFIQGKSATEEAVALLKPLVQASPRETEYTCALAHAKLILSNAWHCLGERDKALLCADESITYLNQVLKGLPNHREANAFLERARTMKTRLLEVSEP